MYKIIIEKPVKKFLIKHKWEIIINQFYDAIKKIRFNPKDSTLDVKKCLDYENLID